MRATDVDWGIMRGPLVLLVVCALVSAALLAGGYVFAGRMAAEHDSFKRRLISIRNSYHTVDEEERLIRAYLPRFRELQESGVVGVERRLDWIEALRDAGQRVRLPDLRYEITSQEPYTPALPLPPARSPVLASDMNLDLGLLHEGDLFRVLDALERDAEGLYSVSQCRIARRRPQLSEDPTEANLSALCRLRWITIRPPEPPGGTG